MKAAAGNCFVIGLLSLIFKLILIIFVNHVTIQLLFWHLSCRIYLTRHLEAELDRRNSMEQDLTYNLVLTSLALVGYSF